MVDKIIEELLFWREKSLRVHSNFREREQYYKRCYELLEYVNWCVKDLEQYEESVDLGRYTILNYARIYAIKYLKMDKKDFSKKLSLSKQEKEEIEINNKFKTFDKYDIALEKLVSIPKENREEIIELIRKLIMDEHSSVKDLRKRIDLFVLSEYPEQGRNLLVSLEEKIEIYFQYIEEKNQLRIPSKEARDRNMSEIGVYLKGYMESDFIKVESYCEEQGITLVYFNRLLDQCKTYDIDLLKEYREVLARKREAFSEKVVELARRMAELIINGVEENGKIRPFDIIDYYQLTTLDFNSFSSMIANRLSYNEIRAIKTFFKQNQLACKDRPIEIEKIRNEKIRFGYLILVDEYANKKEYYYPNEEERELIISFMEQNMPLNAYNYSKVLLRYLANTLPLKQENKTKKLQLR